jgi:hypothetical protein
VVASVREPRPRGGREGAAAGQPPEAVAEGREAGDRQAEGEAQPHEDAERPAGVRALGDVALVGGPDAEVAHQGQDARGAHRE